THLHALFANRRSFRSTHGAGKTDNSGIILRRGGFGPFANGRDTHEATPLASEMAGRDHGDGHGHRRGVGGTPPRTPEPGALARAPETVTLLREPGKPDRKCIIERTTPQADGTLVHELRDANTGEKFRVTDSRRHKGLLGQPAPAKSAEPPLANPLPPRRLPTTAELAGYATPPVTAGDSVSPLSGVLRRTKPAGTLSPVQLQM